VWRGQREAAGWVPKIEQILAKRAAKGQPPVKTPTVKASEPAPVARTPTVIVKKRRKVVLPP